jgi:DNA-binding response OmpR family regulator
VIVVSIVDERTRGVELGAAAYLVKPVRREDLLSALASVGALEASHTEPGTKVS